MSRKLAAATAAGLRDPAGRRLAEAIDSVGGRGAGLDAARRAPDDVLRYLELHIEQAVSLDRASVPLGVVTAIAAPSRYRVAVRGRQDHAGGTPMADRRDAVAAAAELVLLVERLAREAGRGMVGTVGFIEARPNMINIVPGEADLLVDFRGIDPAAITATLARFETETAAVAARRGVAVEWTSLVRDAPLTVSAEMVAAAEAAAGAVGVPWRRLTSGASHDANHMARLCPIGLLFIPCRDGRSHCPEEWAEVDHLATGARVLLELLLRLDRDLA
jgi:N-carbamoyl-L-amino-acid hydrolase